MIRRIAQRIEHHHAVGHGRKNRAEPVLAVEPLGHPGHRARRSRAAARPSGKYGSTGAAALSTTRKNQNQGRVLLRRFRRRPERLRRLEEQFVDPTFLGLRASGLSAISTSSGTMTVRLQ